MGIQTFSRIIREGYVYVDKTDLVWQLKEYATFVFLSRPRRFGKSLLTSTLESFFLGDRELFKGLKIMGLEKEWKSYPVIHLDLSTAKGQPSADALSQRLMLLLDDYAEQYGRKDTEITPGALLEGILRRASSQTASSVVVIVDEYDAPLFDVLHDHALLDEMRKVMQEFYVPLKANERLVKFCFITGVTKFSQLSIFSTINNMKNVSMLPRFAAICGITEEEVKTCFHEDIHDLADVYNCSDEEMFQRIKLRYDGYHFSSVSPDIYNPYSLLNTFLDQQLGYEWFATGTPTFLIRQLRQFKTDITALEHLEVPSSAFDQPTENMSDALPLLYQSGYLTIKDYDPDTQSYTLSIPNQEVRVGYVRGLLPEYSGLNDSDVQMGFAAKFWKALRSGDVDLAMHVMQSFFAGIPYVEGFRQKLKDVAVAEGFYEYTMYLVFSMLNVYVRTQVKCSRGRVDMVVWTSDAIYVFELKVSGSAEKALRQINDKGYAIPYLSDGRKVVKVGVCFNTDTRIPESWSFEVFKN